MTGEEIKEIIEREFPCDCSEKEIRFQIASNGIKHYYLQCSNCGEYKGISKAKLPITFRTELCKEVDRKLHLAWFHAKYNRSNRLYEQSQEEKNAEWWKEYNAYLKTSKWFGKRERVLVRDNYTCQACLSRPATQVHHLSYRHAFNEPLFDLISVCDICHEFLTKMDRNK